MQSTEAIAAVPLFSGLSDDQLNMIAGYLKRRTYRERDVIVQRDSPGDALFILMSGRVKVAYLEDEGETIIAVFSAGEFFGELSILDGEGRSADVIALEPTEAYALEAADFHACINAVPDIAMSLLRELAGRLRRSTGWIHSLSSQDVYGRIAQQLLYLSDSHGVKDKDDNVRITLRLTQNDVAGLVGASRESVNKAMGYFKSKGYIIVDSGYHITVLNRDALEKRCK